MSTRLCYISERVNSFVEGLWPHGISGDLPILLLRVVEEDDLPLVRGVLQAQEYWRLKGLRADVVILNEHPVGYLDEMHGLLTTLLDNGPWRAWSHQPGGAYLLRGDRMGDAERVLLASVARSVLSGDRGDLSAQLEHAYAYWPQPEPPDLVPTRPPAPADASDQGLEVPPLALANGLGGFGDEGRDYVVLLEGVTDTPLPWANVIANPGFGTLALKTWWAVDYWANVYRNRLAADGVTFKNGLVNDDGVIELNKDAFGLQLQPLRHFSWGIRAEIRCREAAGMCRSGHRSG